MQTQLKAKGIDLFTSNCVCYHFISVLSRLVFPARYYPAFLLILLFSLRGLDLRAQLFDQDSLKLISRQFASTEGPAVDKDGNIYFTDHIKDKGFYTLSHWDMIRIAQSAYYRTKIAELASRIVSLEKDLHNFSFDAKMREYTEIAMRLFKNVLYNRYQHKDRPIYQEADLRGKSASFIEDYPVIMSTTYSLRRCLAEHTVYDYVIIDEFSQMDLATGALALSCARRAVIVGDLKQLPNVVDATMAQKTDAIFHTFKLSEPYHYAKKSLLASITQLFPDVHKTLLKEHYRCHPKIIEFCNRKFYNDQLSLPSMELIGVC